MNNKITPIFFTHKRALQLDASLKSAKKNFFNMDNQNIHVIIHENDNHKKAYEILKKNFEDFNINYYHRKKISFFNLKILLRPLNYLWLLKWKTIISQFNNFKFILEDIIKNSKNEFITFIPDDQIFFEKTIVPIKALQILRENKNTHYYRFFTGNNMNDEFSLPKNMKVKNFVSDGINFFQYSNSDKNAFSVWKYRFTIEGTVFHRDGLLNLLIPFIYHNPITLEGIGLWESRFRKIFNFGLSTNRRSSATYQINNVQKLVDTPSSNFDVDYLMKLYMDGYRLEYDYDEFLTNEMNIVPKQLKLNKEGSFKILKC